MTEGELDKEQGKEYSAFVQNELNHEYSRREAVNTRAAAAIVGSTGLVTIVLAVVAVLKGKDFTLTGAPLNSLMASLVAFLVAAVLAVLAGLNWKYEVTKTSSMREMVTDRWTESEVTARNRAAYCNLITIDSLRAGTSIKFRFLIAATIVQIVAIGGLASCVLFVITD